jgi:hypothetical protein
MLCAGTEVLEVLELLDGRRRDHVWGLRIVPRMVYPDRLMYMFPVLLGGLNVVRQHENVGKQ